MKERTPLSRTATVYVYYFFNVENQVPHPHKQQEKFYHCVAQLLLNLDVSGQHAMSFMISIAHKIFFG